MIEDRWQGVQGIDTNANDTHDTIDHSGAHKIATKLILHARDAVLQGSGIPQKTAVLQVMEAAAGGGGVAAAGGVIGGSAAFIALVGHTGPACGGM